MGQKSGGMALTLLIGIGIGAAAGLLMAPRKGEETREMIRQRAMEARDRMKHGVSEKVTKAKQAVGRAKNNSQQTADEIASRLTGDERPR